MSVWLGIIQWVSKVLHHRCHKSKLDNCKIRPRPDKTPWLSCQYRVTYSRRCTLICNNEFLTLITFLCSVGITHGHTGKEANTFGGGRTYILPQRKIFCDFMIQSRIICWVVLNFWHPLYYKSCPATSFILKQRKSGHWWGSHSDPIDPWLQAQGRSLASPCCL